MVEIYFKKLTFSLELSILKHYYSQATYLENSFKSEDHRIMSGADPMPREDMIPWVTRNGSYPMHTS